MSVYDYCNILRSESTSSEGRIFFSFPHQNSVSISLLPHMCLKPRPYHPYLFTLIMWALQIVKVLIMQFSTVSDQTHFFSPKCLPQHPVLIPYSHLNVTRRFTHTHRNRQICSFVCVNLLFVDVKREGRFWTEW